MSWVQVGNNKVRDTGLVQLVAVPTHSGEDALHLAKVQFPFPIPGLTNDKMELWLPGSYEDGTETLDTWFEEVLGSKEQVRQFVERYRLRDPLADWDTDPLSEVRLTGWEV